MKNTLFVLRVLSLFFLFATIAYAESRITLIESNIGSSAKTGQVETIEWQTMNFPPDGKVNVNLIQKVGDSPAKYTLIKELSKNTENDGSEDWIPNEDEVGRDLMIEVTCSDSKTFRNGCASLLDNHAFAVKEPFGSNIANTLDAIKSFFSNIF